MYQAYGRLNIEQPQAESLPLLYLTQGTAVQVLPKNRKHSLLMLKKAGEQSHHQSQKLKQLFGGPHQYSEKYNNAIHLQQPLTGQRTRILFDRTVYYNEAERLVTLADHRIAVSLHVTLNPYFPQMIAERVEAAFMALQSRYRALGFTITSTNDFTITSTNEETNGITVAEKLKIYGAAQCHMANEVWKQVGSPHTTHGDHQKQHIVGELDQYYHSSSTSTLARIEQIRSKLNAAVFFHSVASLLQAAPPAARARRLIEQYEQLHDMHLDLGNEINQEYSSIMHPLEKLYQDSELYFTDFQVTLIRWLYMGCCADPNIDNIALPQKTKSAKDIHVNRIVLSTDWCFHAYLRRLIRIEFRRYQLYQLNQNKTRSNESNQTNSSTAIKPDSKQFLEQSSHNKKTTDLPKRPRFQFDFNVLDFDPKDPFSVLDNVPLGSLAYQQFLILCQVYSLDYNQLASKYPASWTDALRNTHPEFDFKRLQRLLQIDLLPTSVSSRTLVATANAAISKFEMQIRPYMKEITALLQHDNSCGIPPIMIERHWEPVA